MITNVQVINATIKLLPHITVGGWQRERLSQKAQLAKVTHVIIHKMELAPIVGIRNVGFQVVVCETGCDQPNLKINLKKN